MAVQNNANIGFEKQIWDAACVLWGHIPAAEYRKVIVFVVLMRILDLIRQIHFSMIYIKHLKLILLWQIHHSISQTGDKIS